MLTEKQLLDDLQVRFEQSHQTLQELHGLTNELKLVNEKLKESEAMKSHFISHIMNEIVNPFASILGLSEHLLGMEPSDWAHVQSFAKSIYKEAFALNFQLKNIFAAAKLEAGEFTPQISNVRVGELLDKMLKSYEGIIEKKELIIDRKYEEKNSTLNQFFKSDPEKLKLIFINLIDNSIRFSQIDGKIILNAGIDNSVLTFSIRDYGIGIKREDNLRIFDRFCRLDNSINSENHGLGIGLSVAKGIIELMSGEITINNFSDGIEFLVCIPEDQASVAINEFSNDGDEFLFKDTEEIF